MDMALGSIQPRFRCSEPEQMPTARECPETPCSCSVVRARRQLPPPAPGTPCSDGAAGGTSLPLHQWLSTRGHVVPQGTSDKVWRQVQVPQLEGAPGM